MSLTTEDHTQLQPTTENITILNHVGEKLVGVLRDTGSPELVILCHGLNSSKECDPSFSLASSIEKTGLSVFRFDFSGNGESEGEFEFGNYTKEAEDIHSVVMYWRNKGREVKAIFGHSKGGSDVLLYASKYKDVNTIINASGRLYLKDGLQRLGKDLMERLEAGPVIVQNSSGHGKPEFPITKESLTERLNTDMVKAVQLIPENIRILTVHGSKDDVVSVDNAYGCDKLISNHTLRIVDGADHLFTNHKDELHNIVIVFLQET